MKVSIQKRFAASRARIEEPLVSALLRPLVYMVAAFVFAYPLAAPLVARAVALGALLGAVAGRAIARSALRLHVLVVASVLCALAAVGLRQAGLQSAELAAWLGPATALNASNALGLSALACAIAAGLRAAALRKRVFRIGEVAFVGVSFSQALASHRRGAINRPFELADSIIAAGGDPQVALLAIGAFSAGLCVVVLLSERSALRATIHLALLAGLLMLVPGLARTFVPTPKPPPGPMAQKGGKPKQGEGGSSRPQGGGSTDEELEFRDNYDTSGRLIPLAVVLLHDDYSPPTGLYYFRQSAFSQYNGRRLVVAGQSGLDEDLAPGFVYEPTRIGDPDIAGPERTTLETTVALLADHNRPFALETPLSIRPEQNPDPGRFRRVYRATSAALASEYPDLIGLAAGDPEWSAEQLAHYLRAPDDPRYEELAQRIIGEMPEHLRDEPVARAVMVALWLSREGVYSLKSKHADAEDPTADFLFGDKTGYCVHFAHAAVYLMRSLEVPSRVGAGYVYEEAARQGGSAMLLSGANSHAWPEVYVEGVGWVVVDVSPERALDPAIQPPDADLQRLLGEMARGLSPLPQGQERPFEPVTRAIIDLPQLVLRVLAIGVPLCLLVLYSIKLWRRLAPRLRPSSRARLSYRAELDRLSDVSLHRRFGESREAFAARIAATVPSFGALTSAHVAAAFGRGPADLSGLPAVLRGVRRELSLAVPRRRRVLGLLHPWSWLYSR